MILGKGFKFSKHFIGITKTDGKFLLYIYHIMVQEGLKPMERLYVHLSTDRDTAVNVGRRHGRPFVFRVLAGQMYSNGYYFFRSVNGVWLTDKVPPKYLVQD